MYEADGSPAYVMSQMGHTSSALALEVYSKLTKRKRDTGARMEALIRGADWARMDTNGADASDSLSARKRKPRRSGALMRLRGRDSNPNFLIQSQASYH
jgi:hypothetical protein